jgi:DNA repair exonuclease SbcCD ATPase subunit
MNEIRAEAKRLGVDSHTGGYDRRTKADILRDIAKVKAQSSIKSPSVTSSRSRNYYYDETPVQSYQPSFNSNSSSHLQNYSRNDYVDYYSIAELQRSVEKLQLENEEREERRRQEELRRERELQRRREEEQRRYEERERQRKKDEELRIERERQRKMEEELRKQREEANSRNQELQRKLKEKEELLAKQKYEFEAKAKQAKQKEIEKAKENEKAFSKLREEMASEELPMQNLKMDTNNLIGSGGFGQVYKGYYCETEVAIKRLTAQVSKDELQEFKREFQVMNRLKHPRIVQFLGENRSSSFLF